MDYNVLNEKAKKLFDKKEFQQALELFQQVDKIPDALLPNLAKCYYYTKQADKALELILPLEKNQEIWIDIAIYYNALGDHSKAFEIYKMIDNENPKVLFNSGWHYLKEGNFVEGFNRIQHGSKCRAWGNEYHYIEDGILDPKKRWNGNPTKHLLFVLEGGLGDEMIFLRWADYLKTLCEELTIACSPSLLRLLTNAGYNCVPHSVISNVPYTHYCPSMTTPVIASIPSPKTNVQFPYINSFAEPYIIKQLDMIAKGRKKIGVRFYGNQEFEHDQFRSPPRTALLNLSKHGQLFSLQLEEKDDIIPNCNHVIKDWQDTYSVFKGLDLLVTSCTSTAHLAGAMGIKCIVLVPLVPYFVWASDDLPWYPENVTVIRQEKYNDWTSAIKKLNEKVEELL
jgi:tetratricopeptide (TPR) repeat protein